MDLSHQEENSAAEKRTKRNVKNGTKIKKNEENLVKTIDFVSINTRQILSNRPGITARQCLL